MENQVTDKTENTKDKPKPPIETHRHDLGDQTPRENLGIERAEDDTPPPTRLRIIKKSKN